MALSALQQVTLLAPSFATNANVNLYLDQAREMFDSSYWGIYLEKAVALQACHSMALALDPLRAGGVAGSVTAKSEGSLSISFSSGGAGASDLGQTRFGLELIRLQSLCCGVPYVTGM